MQESVGWGHGGELSEEAVAVSETEAADGRNVRQI